jgi:hypothetical protein
MTFACKSDDSNSDPHFHGMWKLDIFESYDSISGTWSYWDHDLYQAGYILYDGKGHMAVHLTSKDYQDFNASEPMDKPGLEGLKERLEFFHSNFVYFAD